MNRANYIARGTASFVLAVAGLWVTADVWADRTTTLALMALGVGMLVGGLALGNELLLCWLDDGRKFTKPAFESRPFELATDPVPVHLPTQANPPTHPSEQIR